LAGLLARADADFIARLLGRANDQLADLSRWCLSDDHFVDLAHFWLTAFPEEAKQDLFRLEHGCLLDQLAFAFKSGTAAAAPVPQSELRRLLLAVFREFPDRLLSARGAHTFLDYLDTLTAGRSHADCRRLLTDVRLATDVRQHAEWLLALRSFAICSVWTAVANFYRALVDRGDFRPPATEVPGFGDRLEGRVVRCVQQGYVEVLHYFCLSGKLDPRTFRDGQSRNLIFLSVTCAQRSKENSAQLRTLRYLLKRLQPDPPVDVPSDTGNSALHLAATAGNLQLAELLVQHGRANVNLANALCDSCTPLHLAVMYGELSSRGRGNSAGRA
uniref:ANK_REP_REGION domain-containing protein n=1 Tax=Macrostomum lignano TaxID=282301 RepID=A0A1I8HMU3_9PLAT